MDRERAQLSVTALEAAVGVLLLAGVLFVFALGTPASTADRTQLDAYADDAATLLASEGPRHADRTRLAELTDSRETFQRERDTVRRRVDRLLPDNLLFRLETEYGAAGYPFPGDVATGTATVSTVNGDVTVRVWYV